VIGLTARLPAAVDHAATPLRGLLGTALVVVLAEPGLWVLGIAGFLLRGGWLLLVLAIWTLPSPVAVTTIVGPDAIGTGGLPPGLAGIIGGVFLVGAVAVVLSAVGAAWADVAAFAHFVRDPETGELRAGRRARELSAGARRGLVGRLLLVYAGALVPAGIALLVAALAIANATYQDFLLPGELDVPLVVRVATASAAPLALLAASIVLAELVASYFTRRILADRFGLAPETAQSLDSPDGSAHGVASRRRAVVVSALGVAALCWCVTFVVVVPGLAATLLGWSAIRTAFLGSEAFRGLDAAVAAGGVTILFVGIWAAALVLAGVSSALRAAVWSGWWLRATLSGTVTNESLGASSSDVPAGDRS
jgi:hypothetical protein